MKTDYLWVLAPGISCIAFSRLEPTWVRRHFPENQDGKRESLFLVHRRNSRAGHLVIDLSTKKLLDQFKRPTTFLHALIRIADIETKPKQLFKYAKSAVERLISSEILVRVSTSKGRSLHAITPKFGVGNLFRSFRISRGIQCTTDTEIYKIERLRDRQPFALKLGRIVHSAVSGGGQVQKMLEHEWRTLRALAGTAACNIEESGTYRSRPYAVLEWIDGVPLAAYAASLRKHGHLDSRIQARLLDLALRVVDALTSIHERGYIHGDVHPGNFLVENSGKVRIVDFGLAQYIDRTATIRWNVHGGVIPFISPESALLMESGQEQVRLSVASEVYSLGAVLYFLITGQYPLDLSPTRDVALDEVALKPVRSFREVGTAPWPMIEVALRKALHKDPRCRFLSLGEFRTALLRASAFGSDIDQVAASKKRKSDRELLVAAVGEYLDEFRQLSYTDLESLQEPPHASLAFGGAGIAYALLRAAKYFDAPDLLALSCRWIAHSLVGSKKQTGMTAPKFGVSRRHAPNGSLYYGLAGIHFVRALVANAMDDIAERSDASKNLYALAHKSERLEPELMQGAAGLLLGFAHLQAENPDQPLREMGQRLSATLDQKSLDKMRHWGLAHGWGGVFFSHLQWSNISTSPLPTWFWPSLRHLADAGTWSKNSVRWPIENSGNEANFMCSWCNGTPGLALLWVRAYETSHDAAFLRLARGCAADLIVQRDGVSHLCCGLAGRSYGLLSLSRVDPDHPWRHHAIKFALKAMYEEKLEHWSFSLFKGKAGLLCLGLDLLEERHAAFPCFEIVV